MPSAQAHNDEDAKIWRLVEQYAEYLPKCSFQQMLRAHLELCKSVEAGDTPPWLIAELCKHDRFLLLTQVLNQVHCLHPWVYERCREVEAEPDDYLDLWARGHFKLLAQDEPVLTPSGWTTHGELEPGDFVFSPSGKPVPVLATSPVRDNPVLYNVILRNGARITADENHLWDFVVNDRHRTHYGRVGRCTVTGTTGQMLAWCEKYAPVRVNIPQALQFPEKELVIPPYTLGAWLGDGTRSSGAITGIDEDIIDNIRAEGFDVKSHSYKQKAKRHHVYGLQPKLKQLGVFENKHIPRAYLTASIEQRRALLRGLMDTDGHMHWSDGKAVFNQIPGRLCDDVEELARGLGYDIRRYQYKNEHQGSVFLAFRPDEHVFGIRRKQDGVKPAKEWFRWGNGFLVDSIERAPVEQGKCIQVLGGRYLVGKQLVPTHNSTIITFGGSFQEIIKDPEITIGIFANDRPISKGFLLQIKTEMELNPKLPALWPHIFWTEPKRQASKWSMDEGLIVQRKGNPREATISAWGLVDAQPTGKHFSLRIYDDVVTEDSVGTPEQIIKTTQRWELSQDLAQIETGSSGSDRRQHVGTRYHFGDTYGQILKRKALKARIYPATKDGTFDGEPVLMSPEAWEKKKRDSSRATVACLESSTRILMADWTQKKIKDVAVGDIVVGIKTGYGGKSGKRSALAPSRVLVVGSRDCHVFRYTFESGKSILATEDHKWWTGRPLTTSDGHKHYNILGLGRHGLKFVRRVIDPDAGKDLTQEQTRCALWLGGMYDGEGSCSSSSGSSYVHITQSEKHNPEVCAKLHYVYELLGFDYEVYRRKGEPCNHILMFRFRGGRKEAFRFLQMCDPVKRWRIARTMFGSSIGYQCRSGKDKLVSVESVGIKKVHSLTTETGNYIAEGCVSKNCQQLLNPIAGELQELDLKWIQRWEVRPERMNVCITVDPANSRKKESCNSAFIVQGVDGLGNWYFLDGAVHKMTLKERWEALLYFWMKWSRAPGVLLCMVGYERYGLQADIDYFDIEMQRMPPNRRVSIPITEVAWVSDGSQAKDDRIRRIIPDMQKRKYFWPYAGEDMTRHQLQAKGDGKGYLISGPVKRKNEQGKVYDVAQYILDNEYSFFPATTAKDALDAMSRRFDLPISPPGKVYGERELIPPHAGEL